MFDERYIVVDIERLQRLLTLDEGTQSLVVFADNESQSSSIAVAVQNLLGQGIVANDWNENFFVASARAEMPIYVIAYLILLIVASFLIINTIAMIIHERIKEIGMMGCLGMTRTEILKVFFLESVFMAVIAASAAAIIGGILTGILSLFPIRMGDMYGNTFADAPISNTLFFQFSVGRIIQAWSLGVIIASLCTLFPSLKSTRIDPVEALRR
jgi:putative ABC transport system permease protein